MTLDSTAQFRPGIGSALACLQEAKRQAAYKLQLRKVEEEKKAMQAKEAEKDAERAFIKETLKAHERNICNNNKSVAKDEGELTREAISTAAAAKEEELFLVTTRPLRKA